MMRESVSQGEANAKAKQTDTSAACAAKKQKLWEAEIRGATGTFQEPGHHARQPGGRCWDSSTGSRAEQALLARALGQESLCEFSPSP